MRLHIRSVAAVAFLLILFIVFAYQASHLNEEAKIRINRSQEKESRKDMKQKDERQFVDKSLDDRALEKLRVSIIHSADETFQKNVRPKHQSVRHENHDETVTSPTVKHETTTNSLSFLIKKYKNFQPTEEVEFPTKEGDKPRIPHIIHQIYTNLTVIANYSKFIQTFVKNNPKWEYRFWSYESGRRLIADRHPYLLPTFDNTTAVSVKRTDFIKYVVLYEYGGFYADLDVRNYRPLDIVTMKFACIIPTEPFEHSAFMTRRSFILNTAILMCRPKHPFFKLLLKNLQGIKPDAYPVDVTGAVFITVQYLAYNNLTESGLTLPQTDNGSNTPYFFKGTRNKEDDNAIYVPNSQYFNDKVDPGIVNGDGNAIACAKFRKIKLIERLLLLPPLKMRGCVEYESRREIRKRKKYTFTEHSWHHLWTMSFPWILSLKTRHIKDIVPHVVLY